MTRRFFPPEVVQTSGMDCGPASLKTLVEGHGVSINYARLREACQTDVDGTSIDTLEETAVALGLDAEQVMVPLEHLFHPDVVTCPAVVVVLLPSGATHFVVLWRKVGNWVLVMDPATGRAWRPLKRFLDEVYELAFEVPASAWRDYAGSTEFVKPLGTRLCALGFTPEAARAAVAERLATPDWKPVADLDAAARATRSLLDAGAVTRQDAPRVLQSFLETAEIPAWAYLVSEASPASDEEEATLSYRGAVLLRVKGTKEQGDLPADLAAAVQEATPRVGRVLYNTLGPSARGALLAGLAGLTLTSLVVLVQLLVLRGLIEVLPALGAGAAGVLVAAALVLIGVGALLEWSAASLTAWAGRRLETRFRLEFLRKLPRLPDRYFQSRLVSDMAERGHSVHLLRDVPTLAYQVVRSASELLFYSVGLVLLSPHNGWLVGTIVLISFGAPFLVKGMAAEQDLRARTLVGALTNSYQDAMVGHAALLAHTAQRLVRREHERLLETWAGATWAFWRTVILTDAVQVTLSAALIALVIVRHAALGGLGPELLLVAYWAFNLILSSRDLMIIVFEWPSRRSTLLRLLEPLTAPEAPQGQASSQAAPGGVAFSFRAVDVRAAGHTILQDVNLDLNAGEHVAVVGRSGAGKSTLVGVLLGWHEPSQGEVTVDGQPLTPEVLAGLRGATAWIDPGVHLFNRTLFDNLTFGGRGEVNRTLLEHADLLEVLERLPKGLQSALGMGGKRVSGGEGQRVRLGRALARKDARLVVLDEAFRGLDRDARRTMLAELRSYWPAATLLHVTHDVSDTLVFERVVVVDGGRVLEDGYPQALLDDPASAYRALVDADETLARALWQDPSWVQLEVGEGQVREKRAVVAR